MTESVLVARPNRRNGCLFRGPRMCRRADAQAEPMIGTQRRVRALFAKVGSAKTNSTDSRFILSARHGNRTARTAIAMACTARHSVAGAFGQKWHQVSLGCEDAIRVDVGGIRQ